MDSSTVCVGTEVNACRICTRYTVPREEYALAEGKSKIWKESYIPIWPFIQF